MRRVPCSLAASLVLLVASLAAAEGPKLIGPATAIAGQEVRLSVEGLVNPDLNTPEGLKPVIAWAAKLSVTVDAPPDSEAVVESDIALNLAGSVKLRLTFSAAKGGVYVVVLLDGNSVCVATKRIVVGPATPPPKPDVKPDTPPVVDPSTKPTAVTYVYEKDQQPVPRPVQAALNKLHAAGGGVVASLFEDDSTNGGGTVPQQYQVPLKAAREAGLPCLVVTAGDVVLRVLKSPTTEAEVLEASK